jgi:hypothetical protein
MTSTETETSKTTTETKPPADKLTTAEKRSLTPLILAALDEIAASAAPARRKLTGRYLVDGVARHLPGFDGTKGYSSLPTATPFKSK